MLQCFFALARAHPATASAMKEGTCLPHGSFTWEHVAQLQQLHIPATASLPTSSFTHAPLTAALPDATSSGTAAVILPHRKDKKAKEAKKADKKRKREEEGLARPEARQRPPRGHPPSPA